MKSDYRYLKVLPPAVFGDNYEVQVFDGNEKFVTFDTANTVDEILEIVKKYLIAITSYSSL